MRGIERTGGSLFSHVDLEARVPARHPLRAMRDLVNASLAALDGAFRPLYSHEGRPSIPPEFLFRAHHWLILHGRYVCKARKPECGRCAVAHLCRFEGKGG